MSEKIGIIEGKISEEPPLSEAEKNTIIIRYTMRKILTDIRDYLEKNSEWDMLEDEQRVKASFVEQALADLTEYAEKLGVEL